MQTGLDLGYDILVKRCSEMQTLLEFARTTENFALNTRGAVKLRRFSSPDLSSVKCSAPHPETGCGALGGGGKGRMTFQTTT